MKRIFPFWVFLLGMGFGWSGLKAAPSLHLGTGGASPGSAVVLPLEFSGSESIAAVQFDLKYDSEKLVSGVPVLESSNDGQTLVSAEPVPGLRKVVVYSPIANILKQGMLLSIPISIRTTSSLGSSGIEIQNVIFGNSDANLVSPGTISSGSVQIMSSSRPRLTAVIRLMDGKIQFQLLGTEGQKYQIQTSIDLLNWNPLSVETIAGGSATVIDAEAPGFKQRFYRAVTAP